MKNLKLIIAYVVMFVAGYITCSLLGLLVTPHAFLTITREVKWFCFYSGMLHWIFCIPVVQELYSRYYPAKPQRQVVYVKQVA